LLPSRVFWSKGAKPIKIKQTMSTGEMWQVSTGSTVWGGGVVLQRYIETLGADFWAGKRVIELGTGTGLGGITAARLGAADVLVTDRDASVLELAEANAGANLGARASSTFRTSLLEWGPAPMDGSSVEPAYTQPWDVVIGADLTYNRDAWPLLVDTIKRLQAPVILTASERRPNELQSLQQFLSEKGLQLDVVQSPMTEGYAARNIRVLRIAKPPPFAKAVLSQAQAPGQMRAAKVPSKSAPARGKTPSGVQAGPSAKEKASELLRYTFNTKEGQLWYEVDTTLKQVRALPDSPIHAYTHRAGHDSCQASASTII
jgi:predicted nicotinamide N-methyase